MTQKKTRKKRKLVGVGLFVAALLALAAWYLHRTNIPVLEPAGQIGQKERNLIIVGVLLSVIVVVPVYVMTVAIALKYRENNHESKKIKYSPDWDHSRLFESIWWGIPMAIIAVLSVITWNSSHALDPYKSLSSAVKPMTIQVVALDWKWLFIYPGQHMASVNMVEFPENTPVDFQITSDTVMNSFWIPQLGGQIYAMPGMMTHLHLVADKTGSFYGSPANIAGEGFARMTFTAKSASQADFTAWAQKAAGSPQRLSKSAYNQLARPSMSNPVVYYSSPQSGLYDYLLEKYAVPYDSSNGTFKPKIQGTLKLNGEYLQ
jgi:cytochrome o ubiquinol oxidase subunit II